MSTQSSTGSIYLCYTGVRGEAQTPAKVSTAPASGTWMELLGCDFAGQINYGQRTVETVQGQGEGSPIRIRKLTDASSPGMMRESLFGTFDKNAVITFMRTGQGEPEEFLRLELQGCGLVEFGIEATLGDRSIETYAIRYGRLSITTWRYEAGGRRSPSIAMFQNEA